MNRLVLIALFLLALGSVKAQKFSGWGKNYTTVNSYSGKFESAAFQVRIEKTGALSIEPGWKISVTAYPKTLSNGKFFPAEKLSMSLYFISGSSKDPGPLPSLSQIGINSMTYMQHNSEAFLIPSSPYHIYNRGTNNSYFDLLLQLNFIINGGSYLDGLKHQYSSPEYPVRFEFKLYDKNNILMGTFDVNHTIQVSNSLSGTPPAEEKEYSIKISNTAKEGLLELKSIADYINGVSVTYNEGLSVTSNTGYVLTVKSQSPNFKSESGETLDLDVMKVRLSQGNLVTLSTSPQVLHEGASTNKQSFYYNITYSTEANNVKLFKTKVVDYKTTLTYEITPK